MRWISRPIRPHAHDFALRAARRDPRMRGREWPLRTFETLKEAGPHALVTNPVWQLAPLTSEARDAFARCDSEFWSVRHPGTEHAFALVIRPDRCRHERGFRGDVLVSEMPERVIMTAYHSTLVVAQELAFTCGGGTSVEGLAMLCHALDDTSPFAERGLNFRRRPPPAAPPLDEEDAAALSSLAL